MKQYRQYRKEHPVVPWHQYRKEHPVISCHQYHKGHPLYRVVNKIPRSIVIRYIITLLLNTWEPTFTNINVKTILKIRNFWYKNVHFIQKYCMYIFSSHSHQIYPTLDRQIHVLMLKKTILKMESFWITSPIQKKPP